MSTTSLIIGGLFGIIYFVILMLRDGIDRTIIFSKRGITSIIILLLFVVLIRKYTSTGLSPVLMIVLMAIAHYFITKRKIKESIRFTILLFIFNLIAELIIGLIFVYGFKITPVEIVNNGELFIINNILVYAFAIFISKPRKNFMDLKEIVLATKIEGETILITSIILIISIIAQKELLSLSGNEVLLNTITTFIFIVVVLLYSKSKREKEEVSYQYDNLLKYIEKYEKDLHNVRKQNHEFKNQLAAIKGMVIEKNINLNGYIDSLIGDLSKNEFAFVKDIDKIKDAGLKGLLYYKLNDIKEKGIKVILSVSVDSKLKLDDFDIKTYKNALKIVGISLDNAIEAAAEAKEKQIFLEISIKNGYNQLTISNTFAQKPKMNKIEQTGYSTKGKKRGYGLSIINDILRIDNKLKCERKIENDLFIVKIVLNKKKELDN